VLENPPDATGNSHFSHYRKITAAFAAFTDPISHWPIKTRLNGPPAYSVSVKWLKWLKREK
jgi:hypothetical protein